jgi:hypothetical protein
MIRTAQRPLEPHKAFIPAAGEHLRDRARVKPIWSLLYKSVHHTSMRRSIKMRRWWRRIKPTRSLSYKHFRAYQPLNTY